MIVDKLFERLLKQASQQNYLIIHCKKSLTKKENFNQIFYKKSNPIKLMTRMQPMNLNLRKNIDMNWKGKYKNIKS